MSPSLVREKSASEPPALEGARLPYEQTEVRTCTGERAAEGERRARAYGVEKLRAFFCILGRRG